MEVPEVPQNGWFIIEHPITMEESLISTRCQLRTMDSFSEGLLHEEKIKDTQEHRKKNKETSLWAEIYPDHSRSIQITELVQGQIRRTPRYFWSISRLPVNISHKPSQGLKDEQVPTGIFGMRE